MTNWPNTIQCLGSDDIMSLGIKSFATQSVGTEKTIREFTMDSWIHDGFSEKFLVPIPSVAKDLMPRDIMSSEPRHWMVFVREGQTPPTQTPPRGAGFLWIFFSQGKVGRGRTYVKWQCWHCCSWDLFSEPKLRCDCTIMAAGRSLFQQTQFCSCRPVRI